RQRVGGGAGGHEEYGNLALEDFAKACLDLTVEIARAVGGGKAGGFGQKAFGDLGVSAGPVVGSKEHEMYRCNIKVAERIGGTVSEWRWGSTITSSGVLRADHNAINR